MPTGLNPNRIVSVTIDVSPSGAQPINFNSALIVGDTDVIDVVTRIRSYSSDSAVATDFGTSAPEYLAAVDFFARTPQPASLYLGRWAQANTSGQLFGAPLTQANQQIGPWAAINNGAFAITINGVGPSQVAGLDFTAQINLNGVATVITSAFPGGTAVCVYDALNKRFVITTTQTGVGSSISFLASPNAGTDISGMMEMVAGTSGAYAADGINAETALTAVEIIDNLPTPWYALAFASTHIVDADHLAIAAFIEGDANPHVYGVTTNEAAAILPNDTTSIGAKLKALGYNRTFYQYSSTDPYAVSSILGLMATVNYSGTNTAITAMFKTEPGVTAEILTDTQAGSLDANNYNYVASFSNGENIIVNGKVASGLFIDDIYNDDWLANAIQVNIFDLLVGTPKVPQTDAGMHQIATVIGAACQQAVSNGVLAPGTWPFAGFGQLKQNDFLDAGYYVYAPPISSQSIADRRARKSVPFQIAANSAGAVHSVSVTVNVNL